MQILTKNWSKIDPLKIESYIRLGGYEALRRIIRELKPSEVIEQVKISGLQGRGGAGCPAALKWEVAASQKAKEKYFICNLDESEPGTYKDRLLAENNPHQIIEGILIGAYAIGSKRGYIYINGHYEKSADILRNAIQQAKEQDLLGRGILGTAFDFELEIFRGAGAYICGEETALLNTIEGLRGEPRMRPPYPAESGLFGLPTVVNNAETLSNLPFILKHGGEKYRQYGTASSPGTKLFLLEGAVKNRGVHEAPLGITPMELIFDELYGGGMESGKEFWFAQIGGAAGRLANRNKLDHQLLYGPKRDYPIGSGSILVVDRSADITDYLYSWASFFHRESCGKCVPCREGTYRLWQIAKRLKKNDARPRDRENAEDILWTLSNTTFCPLGSFAATAWKDALAMFGKEIFG